MKFTLSWLKDHLDTQANATQIGIALTDLGLEVESITDRAAALAPFKTAYVIEARPHPNADKLRVCDVETAEGMVQVVCGAPNARTGMKAVFAPMGSTIPGNGLVLKPSQIRGVESQGMLVSEREMGLSDEHDGIIEMPADTPVGVPFASLIGLDDPVFDIAITPNRGDCLAVRGIARDLAAAGIGTLEPAPVPTIIGHFDSPIKVATDAPDACWFFAGRFVRGVKNGPSPDWLQKRLRAVGLRPISALVDITNLLSLDRGRPLHVYDAAKVSGHLTARLARAGERLEALDGKTYSLDETMCVIADDSAALGLAGVMGGASSGVSDDTVDVFIESAVFDPIRTAQTGRKTGIVSDARQRFERGIDATFTQDGLDMATQLVIDLCGGVPSHAVTAGKLPEPRADLTLRPGRLKRLTGLAVPPERSAQILEALGCVVTSTRVEDGIELTAKLPPWRPDLHGEADLIEEITRVVGLASIPSTPLPQMPVPRPALTSRQIRPRVARRALAARGLSETVSFSFIPQAQAKMFGQVAQGLTLLNPISADLDTMRPNLLTSLLAAAHRNAARAFHDVGLFEVAPQYAGTMPTDQHLVAAGIRRGVIHARHWTGKPREVDAYDAKADALAVLDALKAPIASAQIVAEAPHWYHPGRSGTLRLGPKNVLAYFGELHPDLLAAMDLTGRAMAFEVLLDAIPDAKTKSRTRAKLNAADLLPVTRDFAFVVDAAVSADALVRAARSVDKGLIEDASVFDIFTGGNLAPGTKSLALNVRLQPREKTLTDEEIEALAAKIVAAVAKATGGALRG
jgi:phenylalanyl-tRNA synthetase beta chain